MAFNVNVRQDPRELALLRRIAVALERLVVAVESLVQPAIGTRITTYRFKGFTFQAEGDSMSLTVKDTDVPGTVDASVAFKDAKGQPAKVDGVPTWVASNTAVIDSVTPAADGLSAKLHLTDTVGASQVTVSADVDLGSGVESKDFVDTVSVIAGDAVAADFTFGTVTPDTP